MTARDFFTDAPPQAPAVSDTGQSTAQGTPAAAAPAASRARAICGTCGHGGAPKQGFVPCEFMPVWTRMSERSLCEFTPVRWVPMEEGKAAKRDAQTGIDQAVAAADRAIAGWSQVAFDFVRLYATQHRGKQFIGHDIVQASVARGLTQPPNAKAWGAPIQRAAREGILKRVGFAEDPNRHGNPVPLWEAA